ncbi:MAG: hypothetical protein A2626_02865 [Candidatus Nealsonbacteria bacterium RIFCSPHIGHO2_01_FULL_38_55]|uniref:Uncharacterized protein n=2 Tax=Candidatus Nealsoniibacteriota TaxID=1817911 RepID=A0A1G2EER3_9BACT|nr:MAG: hypothetical protein US88_C0002G0046 [Parcubacteria group bacterium GW2011_GWA2_38_27]KKQ98690.1 MAG: hypothetical protein UT22_C0001G0008 [Parcubacteria group bacterium GW2011_GWC2_39_11]OGZ19649.1 MAG: hypothetical protein A2626_02865 [Candidatus Nealsonbacteria bacterium RIFCSPHIGHO2_01_FULL_38_55]OGZ20657.1 MAG: hypothetical protein A2W55_01830 [Candidatus Nealsonbacteria bacterium RIFCSPHIGHO2_02_38_10]OGZ21193.1 MAG: hypothetical protein A3C48_02240 [Candidatus Nealsonbacteria bac
MEFIIENNSEKNVTNATRKIGYFYLPQREEGNERSFVRPLQRSGYPRFHFYLKMSPNGKGLIFSLHLDQKRPVYKGTTAHSGEYDSLLVKQESERIKKSLG